MKIYSFVLLLLGCPVLCMAYQAGPTNRANFDSAAQQQPAGQQQAGYRSFSNYNNRFGQGVQTSTVQTSVAGSTVKDFSANNKQQPSVGKQAAAPAKASSPVSAPGANVNPGAVKCEGGACKGSLNIPKDADPAAAAQQIQNMMQQMKDMTSGAAAGQPGGAAGGQAMPAMPDLSALMGGGAPAASSPTQK